MQEGRCRAVTRSLSAMAVQALEAVELCGVREARVPAREQQRSLLTEDLLRVDRDVVRGVRALLDNEVGSSVSVLVPFTSRASCLVLLYPLSLPCLANLLRSCLRRAPLVSP